MEEFFNFNSKKSFVFKAVKFEKFFLIRFAGTFKKIFFWISILVIFFLFLKPNLILVFFGLFIFFLSLSSIFWQIELFLNSRIKNLEFSGDLNELLKEPSHYNLADFFSFESAKAISEIIDKKNKKIDSFFIIKCLLKESKKINFVFSRLGLSFQEILNFFEKNEFSEQYVDSSEDIFKKIIISSIQKAVKKNRNQINPEDILIAVSENDTFFKNIFIKNDIESQDIEILCEWFQEVNKKNEEQKKFWKKKNLIKKGSLAKDWTSGYTLILDKYSIDWTDKFRRKGFQSFIGHTKEIESMERILSRKEINNVLIVGEGGIGRKTMIYELAKRSFYGDSLPEVNYKRIVELDIPFLLAQTKGNEEVENLLDLIFKEVASGGNIILVISDFHNFIETETKPGKLDISGVLSPYLHFPQFQIIGITDHSGFRKNIEKNLSIVSFFEKIEVSEITEKETLKLLQKFSLILENKHKKIISYSALKSIILYSSKYLTDSFFPKKAMDLLDEAMVYLVQSGGQVLLPKNVADIVSQKTNMPIGELDEKEKGALLNLENLIHQRVVGQKEAVNEISSALRRSRAEISERKKPMGCFLFLGPTGVGKTETAKALSQFYFGSEGKMIRIDMSEFQNLTDIARLIGSSENEGFLTIRVRENPFSLILLDEIEKAHPDILNIFLQVLDEGYLTDGFGRKIDFKNSIIIATSNAGSQFILENIERESEWESVKENLLNNLFKNNIFRPEFINRFDSVVVFKPLTKSDLLKIVDLIFNNIICGLKKKNIDLELSQELKESLVEIGYNPSFGARELKRVIQDKIENSLASAFLSGNIKKGDKIRINPDSYEVEVISK